MFDSLKNVNARMTVFFENVCLSSRIRQQNYYLLYNYNCFNVSSIPIFCVPIIKKIIAQMNP